MVIAGIIPARYASTRFPGKPLAMIGNMTMIERVYRQAEKSALLNTLVVATDDQRIIDKVKSFGGNAVMTSAAHQTGTERCAEAVSLLSQPVDAVINIQGDEPFLDPAQVNQVAQLLSKPDVRIATLVRKATTREEVTNQNSVKVIVNKNSRAVYFSRLPVPYYNEKVPFEQRCYYVHVGIYGYPISTLKEIVQLKNSALELAESLEQLRWIDNGYSVHAALTESNAHAVDTPEDLESLKKIFRL